MPEHPLRVYLDSNVLFSASRDLKSRFVDFWRLQGVSVAASQYAVGEVVRNIRTAEHRQRFESLMAGIDMVSDADVRLIPNSIRLVAKDAPILAAAIGASVEYLATGDNNHFGTLYGAVVSGVHIVKPTEYLLLYMHRLRA